MKSKLLKIFLSILLIIIVVFTAVAYRFITTRYDYGQPYNDMTTYIFGKKEMVSFREGMRRGTSREDPNKHPEDDFSKLYFDIQVKPDGTMVLYNRKVQGSDIVVGIHLSILLEASTHFQNGKYLQSKYDDVINNAIFNNVRDGSEYGLDRYVRYMKKDGNRLADFDEVLVTMKDDKTPLRILEAESPPSVREYGGGGVAHYFMYNEFVQVEMNYQKYYLKDWQFIEDSMIAYLDQLYEDAER